ncbi:signal peptide peptidase SppA [Halomonas sp. V046]|uniref:signal peptide peptidase SppA n=1 Tax=Halomonas sp. V046 TaxID=3459611 RepID=UPI0040441E36
MSDEHPRDPWTQGDEVPAGGHQAPRDGVASADAETLRERQRLAQIEMMDRWVGGVLTEQRRSRRWKLFFRLVTLSLLLSLVALVAYAVLSVPTGVPAQGKHLGLVEFEGVIDSESPANAERIIEGVEAAWEAPDSVAVVLHINSPGGSPVQSQRIYDSVMRLRESGDKPIIAVIEDIGASGAYYVAAAADEIVASPASLVGSIGVIYAGFDLEDAIQRLGVERRVFTAGDNKAFLDPFSDISPQQREFWQTVLETTHRQFIDDVKAGRGDRLADDPSLFSGLVWTGEQALDLGLVDSLGSIDDVARERLEDPVLQDYTPAQDPFDRVARQLGIVTSQWLGMPQTVSPLRYELP